MSQIKKEKISVIIPMYNESESIAKVLEAIPKTLTDDIVVVDNGSVDGSDQIAREHGASFRLISMPDSFDEKSEGVFDQAYMNDLYQLGYSMGKSGKDWVSNPRVF